MNHGRHVARRHVAKLALVTFALALVGPDLRDRPVAPTRDPEAAPAPPPSPAARRLATFGRACTFGDWLGR